MCGVIGVFMDAVFDMRSGVHFLCQTCFLHTASAEAQKTGFGATTQKVN
ncbi:MAG: hypothetical protein RLZZ76_425 [Candidatus Parcubacteria bacterium]|jgi:hypothetical protein